MRMPSRFVRFAVVAVGIACLAPFSTLAQTFSALTGTDVVIAAAPTEEGPKVTPPAHRHHAEERLIYAKVRDGVYTVDGMVAKVQLNYDVNGANYMYLFVPGLGTAVISVAADPNAVTTQARLHANELSFTAGEHHFRLTGVAIASDKGNVPEHLYVHLDRSAWWLNRLPMVGFGKLGQMPYEWPGVVPVAAVRQAEEEPIAPPVPAALLPSTSSLMPSMTVPAQGKQVALQPIALR